MSWGDSKYDQTWLVTNIFVDFFFFLVNCRFIDQDVVDVSVRFKMIAPWPVSVAVC